LNKFIKGKTYKDSNGDMWKVRDISGDSATIIKNKLIKKSKIIKYCGVEAMFLDFGKNVLLSNKIKPVEDTCIEIEEI